MIKNQSMDINFFTTYHCNSRCINCNIWKTKNQPDQPPVLNDLQLCELFEDPLFRSCGNLGMAGGEPTISEFFWRLLRIAPVEKQITITTNSLSSQRLKKLLAESKTPDRYTIQLSLDGLGAVNDRIRGIDGAYGKTLDFLEFLSAHNIKRLISFTINRINFHEMLACYQLAEKYGAGFSARMAYCGGAYENLSGKDCYRLTEPELESLENQSDEIIAKELAKPDHFPARLVFLKNVPKYANEKARPIKCLAMDTGLVIDLYGNVFPNCPVMMHPIGSLHESSLSDIWNGEQAREMRSKIARFQCGGCWNDCQVVTNISFDHRFCEAEYTKLKQQWLLSHPPERQIDFTGRQSSLLLSGWHAMEGDETFRYRWTDRRFSFFVPQHSKKIEFFGMIPDPVLQKGEVCFKIDFDGNSYTRRIAATPGWETYSFELPPSNHPLAPCAVELETGFCPYDSGLGEDRRSLGIAIGRINFL